MIITNANELASKIHDRMPVLLQPKDFDGWLTGTAGAELLKPGGNEYLPAKSAWPYAIFSAARLNWLRPIRRENGATNS